MEVDIRRDITDMARNWWLFLITGLAWLVIAMLVLRFDITSIATVGVLLGALFLFAAINEFIASTMVAGGWRWVHIALGVLFVLGSVWGFVTPINTFYALASILGLLLVFTGTMNIVSGALSRDTNPLWWLTLLAGILEVLLAIWVSQQFFPARAALILLWAGFWALFKGISEIALAFELRHARTRLAPA